MREEQLFVYTGERKKSRIRPGLYEPRLKSYLNSEQKHSKNTDKTECWMIHFLMRQSDVKEKKLLCRFAVDSLNWVIWLDPSRCFPWNKLYFANSFTANLAKMKVWIACLLLLFLNQTSGEDTGERKWCSSISSQHVFFSKELKRNKRRRFVISLGKSLLKSKWVLLSASLAI